ncbi:MAG: SBBP repeat-containing protein [Phycisphaerales bacterium JB039]
MPSKTGRAPALAIPIFWGALCGTVPPAAAQSDTGFLWDAPAVLSPAQPTITLHLFAEFPAHEWAFAGARLDVLASEPGWSDPTLVLRGPGTTPGSISGSDVLGLVIGQLNFPSTAWADPTNPIEVWKAEFAITDFAPRTISIATETRMYAVYPWRDSSVSELRDSHEGFHEIRVVPAPGALGLLGIGALAATRRRRILGAVAGACALTGAASAQMAENRLFFELDRDTLSPAAPTATVRLWAQVAPTHYAFAGARLDALASEPGWSDPALLLLGPGTSAGVIDGPDVTGIISGQLHFPPAGIWSDPRNPIEIWEADFTVTDFSARTIELSTRTSDFWVYFDRWSFVSGPVEFDEALAQIRVVPAPGALGLLGLGGILAMRRRRRVSRVACAAGALALLSGPAAAEDPYGVAWIRQLGASGEDDSHAVALDSAGNAYICGHTDGSLGGPGAGHSDVLLAKYDASGALVWLRQFGTSARDLGASVAADSAGNVYASGLTQGNLGGPVSGNWDAFLAKHDASGKLLWIQQFGPATDQSSISVAVDSAGSAYVSGSTWGSLGGPSAGGVDAFLAKYDASGAVLWVRQIGTPSSEWCHGVAVDSSGNAYIAGRTFGSLGGPKPSIPSDVFLAKYDPSGARLWVRQLGSTSPDWCFAVAVDGAGNAYISGMTEGSLGGPYVDNGDAILAKYDPSGTLLWVRQLGTRGVDIAYGVATDTAGNAYISGWTAGGALLAKYNPAGDLLWTRALGTPEGEERSRAVAVDSAGNAYISGHTSGSLGGASAGGLEAFLAKYSACPADCDGDGELTAADFLCFQSMFTVGGLGADCDEDRELTLFDFLCYQNAFAAGCS